MVARVLARVAHRKLEVSPRLPTQSAAWQDPELAAARLGHVIAHQNRLRSTRGLPLLDEGTKGETRGGTTHFTVRSNGAFDSDESTTGVFQTWGDALMRGVYGDVFSLNHVYRFEQGRLIKAQPYAEWALEQTPGSTVRLFRKLSADELCRWQQGDFEHLGASWGHTVDQKPAKVLFFSIDQHHTSAGPRPATIELRVPKALLLRESKRGALWSSATNFPDATLPRLISEFVIEPAAAREALARSKLIVHPASPPAGWSPKT